MAFIVFEGGEGTGKTTQLERLWQRLQARGTPCLKTREPGGTPLAENIRALFKAVPEHGDTPTALTELMLVMGARAQHLEKVLKPALEQGKIVLCDRFLDSSYVYQWKLGKLAKEYVDGVAQGILQGLVPSLTFVFTVSTGTALERLAPRKAAGENDRLDNFDAHHHALISTAYLDILKDKIPYPCGNAPERIQIDGHQSIEALELEIASHLSKRFPYFK
jgi:dTMP kinase